jgi:hypothetical protein
MVCCENTTPPRKLHNGYLFKFTVCERVSILHTGFAALALARAAEATNSAEGNPADLSGA